MLILPNIDFAELYSTATRDYCAGPFLGVVHKYNFLEKYSPLCYYCCVERDLKSHQIFSSSKSRNLHSRAVFVSNTRREVQSVYVYVPTPYKKKKNFRRHFEDEDVREVGNCGNRKEHHQEGHHWQQGLFN